VLSVDRSTGIGAPFFGDFEPDLALDRYDWAKPAKSSVPSIDLPRRENVVLDKRLHLCNSNVA
jgi:hypothetical protein